MADKAMLLFSQICFLSVIMGLMIHVYELFNVQSDFALEMWISISCTDHSFAKN